MIKSALTLTEEDLRRMAFYVRHRVESIEASRSQGWIAERERFEREWNDDFSHRSWESAVFAKSNESLNLVGSGVDYIRARVMDEIFGSKPWFSADFQRTGAGNVALSDDVIHHLRWKLGPDQIDFESVASDLITQACKLGECVAKISFSHEKEEFERVASILWDHDREEPVITAGGEFIFESEAGGARRQLFLDMIEKYRNPNEEWRPGCGGDLHSILPPSLSWKEQIVSEERTNYVGARVVPLHYKEFYCPLNAPSLHEADFVAHLTSMRLSELCAHLGVSLDDPSRTEQLPWVQSALHRLRSGGGASLAEVDKATGDEASEFEGVAALARDPEVRILEAYFDYDVRGNGSPARLYMIMAYDAQLPIFWDYIANITPGGRVPFEVVVVNKEPHRWYGKSWFQKYERFQQLTDKLLNQILYRNELAANPIKFRRREAVVQWQDDQPFEVGPDKVFDLNDGYSADDALQTARIPELDEQTKYLLEMVISNWRTRSGVTTATQGTFANLPSERTASGIAHILESGATIFRPQIQDVKRGLEAVLRQVVEYQYTCQAEDEIFSYRDGETQVNGVLCLKDLNEVDLQISLTLTRAKQIRNLESARMAVDFFAKFLSVPDRFKGVAAPLFSAVYKNLEIENANLYFQQVVSITESETAEGGE